MASRKAAGSRNKGKFAGGPAVLYKQDALILKPEVGPPKKSPAADLTLLMSKSESDQKQDQCVPKFDGIGGIKIVESTPPPNLIGLTKKHKDLMNQEFVHPIGGLTQIEVPIHLLWDDLIVSYTEGPHNFWVRQDQANKSGQKFEDLCVVMNEFYNWFHKKHNELTAADLEREGFYVVRMEKVDQTSSSWHRCQIKSIDLGNGEAVAYLVDKGMTKVFHVKEFRRIKKIFADMPIQAYNVALKGLEKRTFEPPDVCRKFRDRTKDLSFPLTGVLAVHSCDTGSMRDKFPIYLVAVNNETLKNEWIEDEFQ